MLELIDSTAAAGGRMIGQTHCRGISVLLSFATKLPFDVLPVWRDVRALAPAQQLDALRDPDVRTRLVEAAATGSYEGLPGVGAVPRKPDFDGIRVYEHGLPPNPTVNEVAAARGVHPVEAMIDLAIESDLGQLFIQPSRYPQDDAVLQRALRHPRTVMTFSDSGAHLSQIADSSIHTFLLGHWVRDRGELTLEEAVRMITLAPALGVGLRRPRPAARGDGRRPQRVRPAAGRARGPDGRGRPPGRWEPPAAEVGGVPRDGGGG